MKILLCICFLCFCFSTYAQKDSLKMNNSVKRDSILTSISKELNVPKGKLENILTAFAVAADSMKKVANNDELMDDEKSMQLGLIAEHRNAKLKTLANENQLAKVKTYIRRRKIPKKIE